MVIVGNTRQSINELRCCPEYNGRRTHIRAAYTAIGMDLLEAHLPEIVGDDMSPFAPWKDRNVDDSIINAAARHHRPDSFLQWCRQIRGDSGPRVAAASRKAWN